MSRNYHVGSRCLKRAGILIIKRSELSFSSKSTLISRWVRFSDWAKENEINKLEKITPSTLINYASHLNNRLTDGTLSPATAQNYVSVINTVMGLVRPDWQRVSPTQACQLPRRQRIATENKSVSASQHHQIKQQLSPRLAALVELQRTLGLRFKESALIDAKKALRQAKDTGYIEIISGTKGGRKRTLPIPPDGLQALINAAEQQTGRSMIPSELSYQRYHHACYAEIETLDFHFHSERHAYAQRRYQQLSGISAPIVMGWTRTERHSQLATRLNISESAAKALDEQTRLQVAEELGHSRAEISNVYLG